jgi:hypothetical protein
MKVTVLREPRYLKDLSWNLSIWNLHLSRWYSKHQTRGRETTRRDMQGGFRKLRSKSYEGAKPVLVRILIARSRKLRSKSYEGNKIRRVILVAK